MDEDLESLILRQWEFVRKSKAIPSHLKSQLGELMEAYSRKAHKIGSKSSRKAL